MTGPDRLRLRDALIAALRVREGLILDEPLIQERSNNGVMYLEEVVDDIVNAALIDAARGTVVVGEIGGLDVAAGTVRAPSGEDDETPDEHARRVIK